MKFRAFTGYDPTRVSGQEGLKMWRVGSRRVKTFSDLVGWVVSGQEIFKSYGWGRIGSRAFRISRVRSGRVMRCSKCHASGRVTMTRELFSADPWVRSAVLNCGSVCLQSYSCLPQGHSSRDPWVVSAGPKLYYACHFLPEGPSHADISNSERTSSRLEKFYQALAMRTPGRMRPYY